MARYWVVRTDVNHRDDVIMPSLQRGELRQGWGYDDKLDLNLIASKLAANNWRVGALDRDERATWRRVQRFWPAHWGAVSEGDLILLPKLPKNRQWTLVRVVGPYRFEIADSGDHGHILPVEVLVPAIANTNREAMAGLQRTMRNQGPMWNIDHLAAEIDRLLEADAEALSQSNSDEERLTDVMDKTLEAMRHALFERFQGNSYERPVQRLLEAMFGESQVESHRGPNERGADFLVRTEDEFGIERRIIVQVKAYEGTIGDRGALEQIRQAATESDYQADAGVILTTAERESEGFAADRDALERELGIPVRVLLGERVSRLFLTHLGFLTES